MAGLKIARVCDRCGGKGTVLQNTDDGLTDVTCWTCKGTKILGSGDVINLTPTYLILEATDSDEYTALDANKKAWYNLFISAGMLDMGDGAKAWDLFLSWIFPPGKKTHAALLAALGQ